MTTRTFLAGAAALALMAPAAALADFSISILHTNDVHSRLEPISKYDSGCSAADNAEGKCFGGSARLITAVEAARAEAPVNLLVDGGDQFQGTLFYTFYKGKAAAEMMNAMAYDGMTVGNHEFDDGPEVLAGFMEAVSFPVLMSNADVSAEPALAGKLMPSAIVEKGGEKIGLIGLTPYNTDELASPGKNITFEDPSAAVAREVEKLTAEGVNKIVVLSHSGYGVDQRVAAEVAGIDVIVGGHTNTLLSNTSDRAEGPYPTMVKGPDGGDTAIVSAYAYGKFLGKLDVVFDDAGKIVTASGEPLLLDGSVEENARIKGRLEELAEPLQSIREEVVAATDAPIGGDKSMCRSGVCEMGVLVADAMLDRVKDQGVDVAITNGGGLRASIDAGEVTMGEVLTVLPFQNTLATFNLKGADLVAALENGVSQVEEGAGRFPQVAGMSFVWDPAAEAGARIVSVEVGGAALDPEKVYGVVSNNYMRSGGDGYKIFATAAADAYDFGPGLEEVVADYLSANAPYTPYVDERISKK
ncbi:5'-nucleotidase [Albimonas donghaensis]|uniref:5'-nucleotidase n=1 Tax=Albimonas donghaensis TaxID=356660 RepID=A0A1H2Y8Z8_9RHOB|nr:5'-nucleotidase C-terminal domain-containing protein [Albimonas donghaensis]SDX01530.1 5'-nucleotidase [Albimonas donghaensis]